MALYKSVCLLIYLLIYLLKPTRPNGIARPRVTLTFDLLTPTLIVSRPCPVDQTYHLASQSVHSFSKYRVHKFANRRTDILRTLCFCLPVWYGGSIKTKKRSKLVAAVEKKF